MKRTTLHRATGVAALALTMSFGLAACGSDDSRAPQASDTARCRPPRGDVRRLHAWTPAPRPSAPAARPSRPRVTARSTAWPPPRSPPPRAPTRCSRRWSPPSTKAGLVDTLNSADALTVFAPTDDAFAKIPSADLNKVLADKATLTKILTHHVVGEKLDPDQIDGSHDTLANDKVTVKGDENGMTVDGAKVLCGNIPTANATVYVIDSVLMPS